MTRLEIGYGGKANVKAWIKREHGVDISDAEADELWEQATQPGGPPIQHTALAHIEQTMELVDTIHPALTFRPWTLVKFADESLITSDTPVVLVARESDGPYIGVGFMTARNILYPLTRKLGLIMGDPEMAIDLRIPVGLVRRSEFDTALQGSTDIADMFNAYVASHASLTLFHHPDDATNVPDKLSKPRCLSVHVGVLHA